MNKFFIKISLVFTMLSFVACAERGIDIVNLRCDYMESPLGIDNLNPVLQWQLISRRNRVSLSLHTVLLYRMICLLIKRGQGDYWDSGKSVVFRIYRPVSRQEVICQNVTLLESDGLG